ncbi:MAG: DUF1194 domain-containing protein [Kiloniellales bacterium]
MTPSAAKSFALATVLFAAAAQTLAAQSVPVDLELVLAVDVSGSMDEDEKALQRSGYVAALRHPDVIDAIRSGYLGRIAVTYVEWAGPSSQATIVPWRLVDGAEAAEALASELEKAPGPRIRGTSISGALLYAATRFDDSGFAGERRVIDISGDGPNNMGPPVEPVREAVLALDITINGLPVILKNNWGGGLSGETGLDSYYRDCVTGGPGAFFIAVHDPDQFADAVRRKLVLEIAGHKAEFLPAALPVQLRQVDCLAGEKWRRRLYEDR